MLDIQSAFHFDANDLDAGGELTHSYSNDGEVKMTNQEIVTIIENAGFEAVERDTVSNVERDTVSNKIERATA